MRGVPTVETGAYSDNNSIVSIKAAPRSIEAAFSPPRVSSQSLLRAAVSLASMMAVSTTVAAQEGGSSGLTLPTIDVTGEQESG